MGTDPVTESVTTTTELNEKLAEFLTLCAQRLRMGENPYKIAAYLQEQSRNLRESSYRITVALHETMVAREDLDTTPPASGFRAHCSCGWQGNWRLASPFAAEEASGHMVEVGNRSNTSNG